VLSPRLAHRCHRSWCRSWPERRTRAASRLLPSLPSEDHKTCLCAGLFSSVLGGLPKARGAGGVAPPERNGCPPHLTPRAKRRGSSHIDDGSRLALLGVRAADRRVRPQPLTTLPARGPDRRRCFG